MELQNNFEVLVDESKCKLKGHLVDSTNLNLYKDIFSSTDEIDMSELHSISWLGVQRFYEMLTRFDRKIYLTNIPPHIYRTILLLIQPDKSVLIKSFILEVFDNKEVKTKILANMDQVVELAIVQGAFSKWDAKTTISGSLHHLCRPSFGTKEGPKMNFASTWCKENEGICNFFYEYSCFMRVILEVCALAQQSTSTLIEESLQQICGRVANLEFGIKSLEPSFSESKSRTLMSLLPHIHDVSIAVVSDINLSSNTFAAVSQTFEAMFSNNNMNNSNSLFEQMNHFLNFTAQISPISKSLEDVGVELGDHILRYGEVSSLRKCFESFPGKDLTDKNIASLRRKLKFDQNKNLTWDDTLKEILNEFKIIQNELGKCIIALQGFDLIRQVLEHRTKEIEIFEKCMPDVKTKKESWEVMRDKVIAQIMDRLVTDQEKYAFAFFFPNVQLQKRDEKLTPGDTFFF